MDVNSTATRFGEDEDIELELCLSLGGSLTKTENSKPIGIEKATGNGSPNSFSAGIGGGACLDALSKREIHAVRRQEARKKREAKQQQRRGLMCRPRNGELPNGVAWSCPVAGERDCKRIRTECNRTLNGEINGVNLDLNVDQNTFSGPYLVSRVRYPYPYPFPNISPLANNPCGSTASFPSKVNDGKSNNPVPQQVMQSNLGNGNGSGQIKDNVKPVSNGSPVSSSSVVSDPDCSPRQGGSSCDSGQTKPDEAPVKDPQKQSTERSNSRQTSTSAAARENGKPPKPPQQNGDGNVNCSLLPFAQMPCVTTTGDGPEGRTVNGFLYRYSNSEISIVCVCHGRSFSPAEFIQHAGGTQVPHPLRHITVVPSTF